MTPQPLSTTARALYAEFQEQAVIAAMSAPIGAPPGTVVIKRNRDHNYLYFQVRDLDGKTRQHYLGPEEDEVTSALVDQLTVQRRDRESEAARLDLLRAAFVAAGGSTLPAAPFRIVQAFAQAGVVSPGLGAAVLVGTNAFQCLGNLLGVRWQRALHTNDIDLAAEVGNANNVIEFGIPRPDVAVMGILERLAMGFLPVPTLDPRSPSTSYFVRGEELRVDLLTPMVGKASGPRFVPAFGAAASPMRHLDFLLAEPIAGLALGPRGFAVVQLPGPARFALHKLMVSVLRPAVFATKADKDRAQALQVLHPLLDSAPDDVEQAWQELVERGTGWTKKVTQALKVCRRNDADIDFVDELTRIFS